MRRARAKAALLLGATCGLALLVAQWIACIPVREPLDGGVLGEARYAAPRFLDTLHPDAAAIRARYGWPYPVHVPRWPPPYRPGDWP